MNPESANRVPVHPPGAIKNLALPNTPLPCAVRTADFHTPRTAGTISWKLVQDKGTLPCTQVDASSLLTLRLSTEAMVPLTATDNAGLSKGDAAQPSDIDAAVPPTPRESLVER
jgi:hypothetical protein